MSLLPNSSVTLAVPLSTISMIVFQAFGESLSVGEMKLPAALFTIMCGRLPQSSTHLPAALVTCSVSRTSNPIAYTLRKKIKIIIGLQNIQNIHRLAVFNLISSRISDFFSCFLQHCGISAKRRRVYRRVLISPSHTYYCPYIATNIHAL